MSGLHGNIMDEYDSRGPKKAFIFSVGDVSDSCLEEAREFRDKIEASDFEVVDDFEDCMNLNALELMKKIEEVGKICQDASCILIYIMACQEGQHLVVERGRKLKIHHIWKKFTENSFASLIHIPKLIYLEVSIKDKHLIATTLLNKDEDDEEETNFTLPATCNMMVFYYPKYSFLEGQPPLSTFLFEEFGKRSDIITNMTSVQSRIVAEKISGAKLSSSLAKLLYLRGRDDNEVLQSSLERYDTKRNGKRLAYAFLFEKFKVIRDLSSLAKKDIPAIQNTFGKDGLDFKLEFCVKMGKMMVNEFKGKVKDIVRSIEEDPNQEVECLIIIVSSHGDENGTIFAHNGKFNVDDIWMPLAKCKTLNGTPVLIFVDACRGCKPVVLFKAPNAGEPSKGNIQCIQISPEELEDEDPIEESNEEDEEFPDMQDILLAMSSTEGSPSYGSGMNGSYFVQELCKKINTHDNKHDILKLLTQVMNVISNEGRTVKQQVTFTSTLLKPFHFIKKSCQKREDQ